MIQPLMIFAGPILWFITRNPRWMSLTVLGVAWFLYDVFSIALAMARLQM